MNSETRPLLQSLAVLVGGAVLGVIGPDLVTQLPCGTSRLIMLTLVAVALILWGSGVSGAVRSVFRRFCRRRRFRRPLIGVLDRLSSSDKTRIPGVWSKIPPSEWAEELQKASVARKAPVRIRLIPADHIHDGYAAIVNPFGGTYPESSFDGYPAYKNLLRYISRGGLFANVADLPTYYAFNPLLRRSIDRTPAVYTESGERRLYFDRVPLLEELAVRAWNCQHVWQLPESFQLNSDFASCGPPDVLLTPTRMVTIEDDGNLHAILEKMYNGKRVTPMWVSQYGNGRVLASLSFLESPYAANRVLVPLLANVVVQQVTGKEIEC